MSNTIESRNQHLTEAQLSKKWNISIKTLQRWRRTGEGPKFIKFAKSIRYPASEVESFEASNLISKTAEHA